MESDDLMLWPIFVFQKTKTSQLFRQLSRQDKVELNAASNYNTIGCRGLSNAYGPFAVRPVSVLFEISVWTVNKICKYK